MKRLYRAIVLVFIVVATVAGAAGAAKATQRTSDAHSIVVFAAASLTEALQELGADFFKSSGIAVKFSFAASSTLARQIDSGALADVYLSADIEWMNYLQTRKLIQTATRHDLLGNKLVLVAPADSAVTLTIESHFDLAGALGKGRLATGDPDSVPAGRYAREALTSLGVWNSVEPRLVRADNVRAALVFVERHEVPLGIVYRTDALVDKGVRIVDTFPDDTHAPITYPLAVCVGAKAGASQFADYLRTPGAAAIFIKYGFVTLSSVP